MLRRRGYQRATTIAPLLVAISLAAWACGPAIPEHAGYKRGLTKPWTRAKTLELDEALETEVDDTISYPRRQRARWYAVDLPEYGEIEVKLTYSSLTLGENKELDVAFEVLNEQYVVLTRADADEEDAGEESKGRTLYELEAGRYFIHIYAQERLDAAEFTLRVQFKPAVAQYESDFPARVGYIPILPAVPPVDDAPMPVVKKCTGSKCKKRKPEPVDTAVRARIAEATVSGAGTRIKINKGAMAGIAAGWKGSVITSAGARIPDGSFTVDRVSDNEAFASVKATKDAVNSAKYVRLRPP
jgi:hypothetical protein